MPPKPVCVPIVPGEPEKKPTNRLLAGIWLITRAPLRPTMSRTMPPISVTPEGTSPPTVGEVRVKVEASISVATPSSMTVAVSFSAPRLSNAAVSRLSSLTRAEKMAPSSPGVSAMLRMESR